MLEVTNVVLTKNNAAVLRCRLIEPTSNLLVAVSHDEEVLFLHLAPSLLHVVHHELDKGCCTTGHHACLRIKSAMTKYVH